MKRFISILLAICTVFSAFSLLSTIAYANENPLTSQSDSTIDVPSVEDDSSEGDDPSLEDNTPQEPEEVIHDGVVSLKGKKIMVVGNSNVYYGNCVIYGSQGKSDKGYLYQLIKQHDENATVIDHTYTGKKLHYIYGDYISKLRKVELDVDYLVLSEGNQFNDDLVGTVEKYLEIFPDDIEFRFLRQPMMFESDLPCLIEGVEALREKGYTVVDWGQMVYDIYANGKEVPGAITEFNRPTFMKENLGFKNAEGTVHASGKDGDRNHHNPLAGYVMAQMLYSSITNRSAVLTDYQFCYDTSIHKNFNIDNFAKVHYTDPDNPTNFHKIFRSPEDMLGLQKLMDEYLVAEGLHPLTVQPEVKPTCINGGLTLGSYCPICQKVVDVQEFIPNTEINEHTLVTTKGKAPTCTKSGKTVSISCSECDKIILKEEAIPPTGHVLKEHLIKATTSSDGRFYKDCIYCDDVIESKTIKKVSTIALSKTLYTYDGKAKTPSVTVADSSGKSLVEGTDYTLSYPSDRTQVGNLKVKVSLIGNYKGSRELTFKIRPDTVKKLSATAKGTYATLKWAAAESATHYRIYKYNSSTKKYSKVGDTSENSYKVKGLSSGTKYKFRVRAVQKIKGTNYYSEEYKYVTTLTTPATSKISKVSSTKKKTASISWSKVKNAEGYEISYSTNKSFKKAKSIIISKKGVASATIKKLSRNKKYYFKVRAYRTLSKTKVYGKYSKVKSKKIK